MTNEEKKEKQDQLAVEHDLVPVPNCCGCGKKRDGACKCYQTHLRVEQDLITRASSLARRVARTASLKGSEGDIKNAEELVSIIDRMRS